MKMVYIASPYTHKSKRVMRQREERITQIIGYLTEKYGYAFIGPITQSAAVCRANPNLKGDFGQWADIDLYIVSKCDEVWVVMMEGWTTSIGVREELHFAYENNIPIRYLSDTWPYSFFKQSGMCLVEDRS